MQTPISWFPGHMAKARRQIVDTLRLVDAVIEVVDARAPLSSTNPELRTLTERHQRLIVAAKADLADPYVTEEWLAHWRSLGLRAQAVDLQQQASRKRLLDELRKMRPRGRSQRLKVMVIGTPNVGKSTLINRLAGRAPTKTGAKPGITRTQQWINIPGGIHLLDTPGMMWPKLGDVRTGLHLAWIGCIGENAYDAESTAHALADYLARVHPERLRERYGIEPGASEDLIEAIGRSRGMLVSGGEVDRLRASETLLQEFRTGKLGRISLEEPDEDSLEVERS